MAGRNEREKNTQEKRSVMRNITKDAIALILAIAALTVAAPALADTYVTEGRVAYKVYSDHAEVWDYFDPGITEYSGEIGSFIDTVESNIRDGNMQLVDWAYNPALYGSGCPWRVTLIGSDDSWWTYCKKEGYQQTSSYTIPDEPNSGTDLVIPARVNGKPVTTMRVLAFGGAITPSDVSRGRACTATTIDLSRTAITNIPRGGFCACTNLVTVKLPNAVTSIGEGAFKWADTLQNINVPTSLKTVGKGAFYGCKQSIQAQFSNWTTASSGGSSSSSQGASGQGPSYNVMYRLYNPNSGEHFYTAKRGERDSVKAAGWTYEGHGWKAPTSGKPVYRLYSGTDHHYTTSATERDKLVSVGWTYEGIGWYSADSTGVPLYRQFNPNVQPWAERNNSGSHNYTTDKGENDTLVTLGWRAEGIGWYGMR